MEATLQLVTRQPSESQPSSGSFTNTTANGSNIGLLSIFVISSAKMSFYVIATRAMHCHIYRTRC
ncbi:hypothetical protein HanHA300_Chr17g0648041 [Helianthus annuus]|nr:hypothetical protein HanHA300_Chr17g0648041 [Helianthus annuus]